MAAIKYKEKCVRCRKNWVITSWRSRGQLCYDCQKEELKGKIADPEMKKFFNIPEQLYKDNGFLRNIKIAYLRYGNLTEKQMEAFKKAVVKMKEDAKNPPPEPKMDWP
ncbi:MAG: hypothetical protein GXP63_03620 [DPANN group archaeon]|nr:hypothetical protein [DPANN group archaeon]